MKSTHVGPLTGLGGLFYTFHGFGGANENHNIFVFDSILRDGGFFHGPGTHHVIKQVHAFLFFNGQREERSRLLPGTVDEVDLYAVINNLEETPVTAARKSTGQQSRAKNDDRRA